MNAHETLTCGVCGCAVDWRITDPTKPLCNDCWRGNKQPAYPDDNPKTAVGSTKVPLHLVPPSAKHVLAEAMADGAKKYGPYNWREKRVSATTYVAASLRHIEAYLDGEDLAPDSLVHHIGHGMACLAILYDALTLGMLNDDRPTKGAAPRLQVEYAARNAKAAHPAEPTCPHDFFAFDTFNDMRCEACGKIIASNPVSQTTGD